MRVKRAVIIGSGKCDLPIKTWGNCHDYTLNYGQGQVTGYGFAGHIKEIEYYRANKIKFIAVSPCFEDLIVDDCIDSIKGDWDASRNNNWTDDDVRYYLKSAKENKDIGYQNMLTVLHLAIYFCIKNGYAEIDLFGCQNNYDEIESSLAYDKEASPLMRKYTDAMVRLAPEFGILINWYK